MRTLVTLLLLASTGCAATPGDEPTSGGASAIVHGTPSTSDQDAVVRLDIGDVHEICSGTLLAPRVVLTAKHCVATRDTSGDKLACTYARPDGTAFAWAPDYPYTGTVAPSDVRVSTDRSFDGDGPPVTAVGAEILVPDGPAMCGSDIALVVLDRDITAVAPRAVRPSPAKIGEALTAIGWGKTDDGKLSKQRMQRSGIVVLAVGEGTYVYTRKNGAAVETAASRGELVVGESACNGDSGGPLLDADGFVVGVTSRTPRVSQRCVDQPVVYTDASAHAALIARALTASR